MRRTLRFLPLIAALLCLTIPALAAPPVQRPSKQYTIEQFMETVSISGASFTADEKQLLFLQQDRHLQRGRRTSAGGVAVPMTGSSVESTFVVSAFLDARFLYTHDQGGNENNHLYVKTPGKDRTDARPEAQGDLPLDARRDGLHAQTNERDERYFDLYLYDAKTYARKLVYQDDTGYDLGAISTTAVAGLRRRRPPPTATCPVERRDPGDGSLSKHEGVATYAPETFDPRSGSITDQRRRGVHPPPTLGARERKDRGRREGRLGRRTFFSQNGSTASPA
jgi:hypothetical protein